VSRSPASCCCAATTPFENLGRRQCSRHDPLAARESPPYTDASRPAPNLSLPTPPSGRPTETERPQRCPQREPHPITIMSPTMRSSTEISLGARAHNRCCPTTRNHSPPTTPTRT
jgi:hypothetical protein